MEKKLGDELRELEGIGALNCWPEITEKLSELMRARAKKGSWGALLVGIYSQQVERRLFEWAQEQGLEARKATSYSINFFPLNPAIWLIWGYVPPFSGECDVEIKQDGSLYIPSTTST